jgi:hypothetical protein
MEKFLVFIDAADHAICMPLSRMTGITVAADATVLVNFENTFGPNATEDKRTFATLTCTADAELAVFKGLVQAINGKAGNTDGVITVCDDVVGTFIHPDIVSCTISLDA